MAKCMRQRPCALDQLQVNTTVELPSKNKLEDLQTAMVIGVVFDVAYIKNLKIALPPNFLCTCKV